MIHGLQEIVLLEYKSVPCIFKVWFYLFINWRWIIPGSLEHQVTMWYIASMFLWACSLFTRFLSSDLFQNRYALCVQTYDRCSWHTQLLSANSMKRRQFSEPFLNLISSFHEQIIHPVWLSVIGQCNYLFIQNTIKDPRFSRSLFLRQALNRINVVLDSSIF